MSEPPLGYSATIVDVIDTLKNPTEYVRCVLGNFYACKIDRDVAVVRIGVSGRGIIPNYKIEIPRQYDHYFTFSGRTHEIVSRHMPSMLLDKWSDVSMSFAEVQALLGMLRKPGRLR